MLECESLYDDPAMQKWDAFVESHPEGTPYHLSCWLRTIQRTYAFEPLLYTEKNTKGDLISIFPFFKIKSFITGSRLVSLPFSDYGGSLCIEGVFKQENLEQIITENSENTKYIEVRNLLSNECDLICHNYYKSHELSLKDDVHEIKKKINKRTIQYSIRKARKAGVEIVEENNPYGMKEFYRLNLMTRNKHGVPSQPKTFFDNLAKLVIEKGNGFILLGVFEQKVIAASLFLTSGKNIHYKYNASDMRYLKTASPNHLLTWSAIEKAKMEGYQKIDFGRTSPDNEGLIRYKEMWGMKGNDLPYYYYPDVRGAGATTESSFIYKIITKFWRWMPDSVTDRVSARLYKHLA